MLTAVVWLPIASVAASAATTPVTPPNAIVRLDGPPGATAAPRDGRIRGDGFAAQVVGVATGERTERAQAGSGQRLWVFGLSVTTTAPATGGAPVTPTVTIAAGAAQVPVPLPAPDGSSGGRVGPVWFQASLPASAPDVVLSMQTSGFTQSFSLAHMTRIGPSPTALYRDPTGSEIDLSPGTVSVLPVSYDMEDPTAPLVPGAGLPVHLLSVSFGYFAPDTPGHQASADDQAWMTVRLASFTSNYFGGAGGYLIFLQAVTAGAITMTVPGQPAETATLISGGGGDNQPDASGQITGAFPDAYFFTVPADLTTATLNVAPGPLQAAQYAEGNTGTATPNPPSATLSLPIDLPAVQPPTVPPGASATPFPLGAQLGLRTQRVRGTPPPDKLTVSTAHISYWAVGGVVVAIAIAAIGALVVGGRRRRLAVSAGPTSGGSPGYGQPAPADPRDGPQPPPPRPTSSPVSEPVPADPSPGAAAAARPRPPAPPPEHGLRQTEPPASKAAFVLLVPPATPIPIPEGTVVVLVLGSLGVAGWPRGAELPSAPDLEALALFALHPGEQFTGEQLTAKLSATRKRPLDTATARRYVNNLRRALGDERIPEARPPAGYQAIGVTSDAAIFERLVAEANDAETEVAARHLAEAPSLVRGVPFADARAGAYGWADQELIASSLAARIQQAATDLAAMALAAGDPVLASWAAGKGLLVWPTDETLHEHVLSAAALQGRSALTRAWAETVKLLAAHEETPSDELTEHYQSLRRGVQS